MHDEYTEVLERAMAWARENRPDASPHRHAAFANSVAYAVTGMSGGYGGPSMREHAASREVVNHGYNLDHHLDYEKAIEVLGREDGVIFGPLTDLHRACWECEHCFDDDPDDVRDLK